MIDTSKYEGHDLAKDRVASYHEIYDRKGNIIFDADDVGGNMATLNLLADAPLLLAEVKQLREGIRNIIEEMQEWTDDQVGKPLFRMFIDKLEEVIE